MPGTALNAGSMPAMFSGGSMASSVPAGEPTSRQRPRASSWG
jgi:hypothetical protein